MLSLILLLAAILVVCSNAYTMVPSVHNNVLRTSYSSSSHGSASFRLHLFGNPEPPKTNSDKKEGGGLFGGMGNMMENVKRAQEIAKQAEVVQRDLASTMITGSDPTGAVVATFNGIGAPVAIKIPESVLAQGAEAVSIAATKAMIDGHAKSQYAMMTKMQELYGGMGGMMPGK